MTDESATLKDLLLTGGELVLAQIPVLSAITDLIAKLDSERLHRLIEDMRQEFQTHRKYVNSTFVAQDQYQELFERVARDTAREASQSKRDRLRNLLINTAMTPSPQLYLIEKCLATIEQITELEFLALTKISARQIEKEEGPINPQRADMPLDWKWEPFLGEMIGIKDRAQIVQVIIGLNRFGFLNIGDPFKAWETFVQPDNVRTDRFKKQVRPDYEATMCMVKFDLSKQVTDFARFLVLMVSDTEVYLRMTGQLRL